MKRHNHIFATTVLAVMSMSVGCGTGDGGGDEPGPTPDKIAVTGIKVSSGALSLEIGDTETLEATVFPTDATDKTVSWSTSATTVATVDAKTGKITAVDSGTATITARTADGGKTDVCVVTVYSEEELESNVLDKIPDKFFRSLIHDKAIFLDDNNDGRISLREAAMAEFLYLSTNENQLGHFLKSLEGIEYFKGLRIFECNNKPWLESVDLSRNTELEKVVMSKNPRLTSIDVSGCAKLTDFTCNENDLTQIDLSGCTSLTDLNCEVNRLSSLDISGNAALEYLNCSNNDLASLDVSGNKALLQLDCGGNSLTSLDVSGNTALKYLVCDVNKLTELDVTGNKALRSLYCNYNLHSGLDLSQNPIRWFECLYNPGNSESLFTVIAWSHYGNSNYYVDYYRDGTHWEWEDKTVTLKYIPSNI